MQVFGSGDTLINEDQGEAGRDEGHGKNHTDGDKYVHRGSHQRDLRQLLLGEVQGVVEHGDAMVVAGVAWWQAGM